MRLLVLGGNGMAGHMVTSYFQKSPGFEVFNTTRKIDNENGIYLDATDFEAAFKIIEDIRPEIVVNCIGLLNENASENLIDAIKLNSLFPHLIANKLEKLGGRLIHISTDCVFSGTRGSYTEKDPLDGTSVYAKTKSLGEICYDNHLTIRTSIIGPEMKTNGIGLFHWFMNQTGMIKGYKNVLWNGVTTLELAKVIEQCIFHDIKGLYHLTAPFIISKHELLKLIQEIFKKYDVEIKPVELPILDRTLVNSRKELPYIVPDYVNMLTELYTWMDNNGY